MKTNAKTKLTNLENKELNHLGLVAAMYDELGIGESIDTLIPQDMNQRKLSIGQILKAMVLNGLGFANQRLYLLPHFFEGKPVDQLSGEGVCASDLNDDVTGRMLDSLYEAGVSDMYMGVSHQALKRLGLSCHMSHIDTTTFHTDGEYDHPEEEGVIQITKGYSRDHRPDLNQFGLKLIVEGQAGIPMMMEVLSGNDNDKKRFKETVRNHIGQLTEDFKTEHLLGDSALYSAETLRLMDGLLWTTRVPETLALARNMIDWTADDLAQENDGANPSFVSSCITYGGVKQRWLVVYSPQAHSRALHTISKQCTKKSDADQGRFDALCKQLFACENDAVNALEKLKKKLVISAVHNIEIIKTPGFNRRGRPAKGATPDFYQYKISGGLASNHHEYQRTLRRKSCFILATNQLDSDALADQQMIANYKNQQKVERGFRFLKDPMFLASSVFLKSPKRIMALTMVMTVCLLVYAALEHRIRKGLVESEKTFPNQVGKLIQKPTIRWIFQYFHNISVIYCSQTKEVVLNLNEHHSALLNMLGGRYDKFYS